MILGDNNPNITAKENSVIMKEIGYKQKKEAYEKAYNKKLNYDFEIEDIAGWRRKINRTVLVLEGRTMRSLYCAKIINNS